MVGALSAYILVTIFVVIVFVVFLVIVCVVVVGVVVVVEDDIDDHTRSVCSFALHPLCFCLCCLCLFVFLMTRRPHT